MESQLTATITISTALSSAVDFSKFIGDAGMIRVPAWTAASMAFYVAEDQYGTYAPLRGSTGSIIEITGIQTAAAAWYPLPAELKGAAWVKVWSETSGSDVNQAAARTLILYVKG